MCDILNSHQIYRRKRGREEKTVVIFPHLSARIEKAEGAIAASIQKIEVLLVFDKRELSNLLAGEEIDE